MRSLLLILICVAIILFLSSPINAIWTCEAVETTNDIGKYAFMVYDGDFNFHISHYDSSGGDLRYCNGTAGNWTCEAVETTNDVGKFTSMIYANSNFHISHYDSSGGDLRYCNGTAGNWTCEAVETTNDVGKHTSIVYDGDFNFHISHYDSSGGNLRYCTGVTDNWTCEAVETTGNVGRFTSIVYADNNLHISHRNATNGNLRYCVGTFGNWTCETAETGDVKYTSMLSAEDNFHISYQDIATEGLRYCKGTAGNWTCEMAEAGDLGGYTSMLSADGNFHISHQNISGESLRYCNGTAGNWTCEMVEAGVGDYTSIVYDGNLHISHYGISGGNLRYCTTADITPPSTSWDGNTNWQGTDQNIHLTCIDDSSGCSTTYYRVDSDEGLGVSYGSWQTYDTNILFNQDGNWALDFNSTDVAGNIGDVNTFYVLLDIGCTTPTSGMTITVDTNFCSGTHYLDNATSSKRIITVSGSNIEINGNNMVLDGNGLGYGIEILGSNVTIHDITTKDYTYHTRIASSGGGEWYNHASIGTGANLGFLLTSGNGGWYVHDISITDGGFTAQFGSDLNIENVLIDSGGFMYVASEDNVRIINIEVRNSTIYGLYLNGTASNIHVQDSNFHDNGNSANEYNVYIRPNVTDVNFYHNNIYNPYAGIYNVFSDAIINVENNYYGNEGDWCQDADVDGYCDVDYNSTNAIDNDGNYLDSKAWKRTEFCLTVNASTLPLTIDGNWLVCKEDGVVYYDNPTASSYAIEITAGNVAINGNRNFYDGNFLGSFIYSNNSSLLIKNFDINNYYDGITNNGGMNSSIIENNNINYSYRGITLKGWGGKNTTVRDNNLLATTCCSHLQGIYIWLNPENFSGTLVQNNYVSGYRRGIESYSAWDTNVIGNEVSLSQDVGIRIGGNGQRLRVEDNNIHGMVGNGIQIVIGNPTGISFKGNEVYGNGTGGSNYYNVQSVGTGKVDLNFYNNNFYSPDPSAGGNLFFDVDVNSYDVDDNIMWARDNYYGNEGGWCVDIDRDSYCDVDYNSTNATDNDGNYSDSFARPQKNCWDYAECTLPLVSSITMNYGSSIDPAVDYDLNVEVYDESGISSVSAKCWSSLYTENNCDFNNWDCYTGISLANIDGNSWGTTITDTTLKDTNGTWTCKITANDNLAWSDTNTGTGEYNETYGYSVDTGTASYSMIPNTLGNAITTDQTNNYLVFTHTGNVDINISVRSEDFVKDFNVLNNADSNAGWQMSGDEYAITASVSNKIEGTASLKVDVDTSIGNYWASPYYDVNRDLTSLGLQDGNFNVWMWLPSDMSDFNHLDLYWCADPDGGCAGVNACSYIYTPQANELLSGWKEYSAKLTDFTCENCGVCGGEYGAETFSQFTINLEYNQTQPNFSFYVDDIRVEDNIISAENQKHYWRNSYENSTQCDTSTTVIESYWQKDSDGYAYADQNLVLWFKFNQWDGNYIYDATDNGNIGESVPLSPISVEGVYGDAVYISGDNNYVVVEDVTGLQISGEITVSTWYKFVDGQEWGDWLSLYDKGADNWYLFFEDDFFCSAPVDGICADFGVKLAEGGYNDTSTGEYNFVDDTWYHFVGTFDGEYSRIYVNGVEEGSNYAVGTIATDDLNLGIGAVRTGQWGIEGAIDNFQVYDRALSPTEIQTLYYQQSSPINKKYFWLDVPDQTPSGAYTSTLTFGSEKS